MCMNVKQPQNSFGLYIKMYVDYLKFLYLKVRNIFFINNRI